MNEELGLPQLNPFVEAAAPAAESADEEEDDE